MKHILLLGDEDPKHAILFLQAAKILDGGVQSLNRMVLLLQLSQRLRRAQVLTMDLICTLVHLI